MSSAIHKVEELKQVVADLKGIPTNQDLRNQLTQNVMVVDFTKLNGDKRVMTCTLQPDTLQLLPKGVVKEGEEKKERVFKNPERSLAVYDTKAEGWRSFLIKNIKSVERL